MPQRGLSAPVSPSSSSSEFCGSYSGSAPADVFTVIFCNRPMSGRYVVVQIPHSGECLVLCEVEIYSKFIYARLVQSVSCLI